MKDPSRYSDDPTIKPSCLLLRRISPEFVVPDKDTGEYRISSQGFTDPTMSVHIGDDLEANGHSLDAVLAGHPEMDLAAIFTSTAREHRQSVCRAPVEDELCHGIVAGSKSRSVKRAFAREATENWLIKQRRRSQEQ